MLDACEASDAEKKTRAEEDRGGERGFILIPVLLALSILGLIAIALTRTVTLDVKMNANLLRYTEAETMADGLARLAIQYLVVNSPGSVRIGQFRLDGTPVACRLGSDIVTISVLDTAGQIDINLASKDILERLFVGIDLPPDDAARLAAAVIDFRDPDDVTLIDGLSELGAYQDAGLAHGPKNAPFATVGELDQVLGMTPAIMARIRPLVTVYSRMRGIDTSVASPEVLALPLPSVVVPRSATRSYVVRVAVRHARSARFTRETVIELTSRAPSGFLIKEWNRIDDDPNISRLDRGSDAGSCLDDVLRIEQ